MTKLLQKAIERVRALRDLEQDRVARLILNEVEAAHGANGGETHDRKPIWEVAQELMKDLPQEEVEKLPHDGATEHDHYIYGTPKRYT